MVGTPDKSWKCFDRFVLRATGVPFDWIAGRGDTLLWDLESAAYQQALTSSRQKLWDLVEHPLFREAVFMSNPQVHGLLDTWRAGVEPSQRPRKERKRERTLYRFLTRFAAKNDTTSFFGATSIGHVAKERVGVLRLPIADVRRTFLEHWAADALLESAAREIGVAAPAGGVPVGHPRSFDFLKAWLAEQPTGDPRTRWQERFDSLEERFRTFETAPYLERVALFRSIEDDFRRWAAVAARRGEGQYYSSKTTLHEVGDRSGQVIGLTDAERTSMEERLEPVMELCALHVLVERLKTSAFVETRIGNREVPFAELTELLSAPGPDYHLGAPPLARQLYAELQEVRQYMRASIDAHLSEGKGGTLELLDDRVESFLARWRSALSDTGRAYTNPDVLVGKGESPELVLGDMHAMPFLTPAAFAAAPSEEEVWENTRAFLADLCAPEKPAFLTHQRPSFVAYVPDLGEAALEIDGRSSVPFERRCDFKTLRVQLTDDGFQYRVTTLAGDTLTVMPLTRAANTFSRFSSTLQRSARVYPVKLLEVARWLVGPGWRTLGELPRLKVGGVVVHRRTWEVRSADWVAKRGDAHASFCKLGELTSKELPRFCYVKGEDDPKPLLVDFADPISAELLLWMARNQPSLALTEMLPDRDSLWLGGPGGTYTSELRCVYFR